VPVEIGSKYTDDDWSQKLMTIEDFIQAFIVNPTSANNKGYLAQHPLFYQVRTYQIPRKRVNDKGPKK